MTEYYETAVDSSLEELKSNPDFQRDLVFFFAGRYGKTKDQVLEMGVDGMYDEFIEHMRWQEVNEATALRDLFFVKDEKNQNQEDIAAFGRLMKAWDNSSTAGEMSWQKTGDYLGAVLSSPSTIAGILTAGVGTGISKLGSKVAGKGLTLAIRGHTLGHLTSAAAINAAKQTPTRAILTGAARGAATEGALALGHETVLRENREEAQGELFEANPVNFWLSVGANAAFGGATGGFSRHFQVKKSNEALDLLAEHQQKRLADLAARTDVARVELGTSISEESSQQIQDSIMDYIRLIENEKDALKPLDKESVQSGRELWSKIVDTEEEIIPGFDSSTMTRLAAAGGAMIDTVKTRLGDEAKGLRITELLSRGMDLGVVNSHYIKEITSKYGVSTSQLGTLIMADMSHAGRQLAVASRLSKEAKGSIEEIAKRASSLIREGIFTLDDEALAAAQKAIFNQSKKETGSKVLGLIKTGLQELDSARIAMLTSQLGTTSANVVSSVGRVGVDMSDQFFKSILSKGKTPMKGILDLVAGMTWKKQDAELMALMMLSEAPEEARKIFKSAARLADTVDSTSVLAKFSRAVNVLNTQVDVSFKSAAFYASISRQLRESGTSWQDFISKYHSLGNIDPKVFVKAKEEALGFTYQRGYAYDPSLYGQAANKVIRAAKDYPFLITSVMPFPRYIANQLEFLHDYTPLVGLTTALYEKGTKQTLDVTKDFNTRLARQITGSLLFFSAYQLRATQEGRTEKPTDIINDNDNTVRDLGRWGGPYNTMLTVADALYRLRNGMATPSVGNVTLEAFEAATGVAPLGYSTTLARELRKSIEEGNWTDKAKEKVADLFATWTYPVATIKDFYSQFDPDGRANTPNTRWFATAEDESDVMGEVSLFGILENDAKYLMRMTRFLPDSSSINYFKSFNGGLDVPIYDPFSGKVVRELNPGLKQLTGQRQTASLNSIQMDMNRLGLKPWRLYNSSTVKNPLVDYEVRRRMGSEIDLRWSAHKADLFQRTNGASSNFTPEQWSKILEDFIKDQIRRYTKKAEEDYSNFRASNPVAAAGYVRHMYLLERDKLQSSYGISFDAIIERESGGQYTSADEWLADSDNVQQEVARREYLIQKGAESLEGWKGIAKPRLD